jgi:ABC-type branched-subunit amino acid transport system substrate-binding protein
MRLVMAKLDGQFARVLLVAPSTRASERQESGLAACHIPKKSHRDERKLPHSKVRAIPRRHWLWRRLPAKGENMTTRRSFLRSGAVASAALAICAWPANAENAPGVTDTEIRIGQTMPYSGPASSYGVIGRAEAAYFRMINEQGGINGRKLTLISVDDGYSPPKTVEQTRRLVEQEGVAFIFGSLGDPTNLAVRQYLNDNKIPQMFVAALAESVADPEHYPWTIPLNNATTNEAHVYAKYILATKPNAKIGVLYQNDPVSKIFLGAIREGLGSGAGSMIVKEVSFEVTDPTVDSQVITL